MSIIGALRKKRRPRVNEDREPGVTKGWKALSLEEEEGIEENIVLKRLALPNCFWLQEGEASSLRVTGRR
jgi:hypothetical protein